MFYIKKISAYLLLIAATTLCIVSLLPLEETAEIEPVPAQIVNTGHTEVLMVEVTEESSPAPLTEAEPSWIEAFVYYDIPLADELQEYTYTLCEGYGIDYYIVLSIMYHESRFIVDVNDNINTNGTRDRGLMQINECNWGWLAAEGLDVSDTYHNIESGILMLSQLYEKGYSTQQVIAAYAVGEAGMKRGGGFSYANRILEHAEGF